MTKNYPKCQASGARFVKEGEQIMRVWADVVWTYRDLIADYVADYDDIDDDGGDENIYVVWRYMKLFDSMMMMRRNISFSEWRYRKLIQ